MPPKPRTVVPIAPRSPEQTQGLRANLFNSLSPYRPIDVPGRIRTGHACNRCRELRAKCSGHIRCAKCAKDDAICSYGDRKRERNKRQFARSVQQIDDLQNDKRDLLAALRALVEAPDFQSERHPDIVGLIEKMSDYPSESSQSLSHGVSHDHSNSSSRSLPTEDSSMDVDAPGTMSNAGESLVGSGIGSSDRQRELGSAVDLDSGIGMPGYVGKMSDVSWVQRIRQYLVGIHPLAEPDLGLSEIDDLDLETTTLSYFTEDHNLLAIDEDYVDPYLIPSWQVAQVLTEAYFHSIQGAFRFIEREQFLQDLSQIYNDTTIATPVDWPQCRTLALANVMWAIGAKWIEMTRLDRQAHPDNASAPLVENQLVYYARARSLGLDHRMQIDHPSLETVQGMAILSFYLLSNGSVHKAWSQVAQTIRHATALGLHLKVLPNVLPEAELKQRSRTWWSLFRMEVLLSEITGRPKCVSETDMTVPFVSLFSEEGEEIPDIPMVTDKAGFALNSLQLWRSFVGDHSRVGESWAGGAVPWSQLVPMVFNMTEGHFAAALELSSVSNKIGSTLYLSPADLTWADVQSTVRDREADLVRWQGALQQNLRMENIGESDINPRSSLHLEMTFCSVRMILYRPFMCEIRIEEESSGSTEFNRLSARAGAIAAIRMMDIMPDDPVAAQVLQIFPWWTLLHYISQATAILCLELCLNVQHMQDQTREVMAALRKALNYLQALAPGSKSAYRAWNIHRRLVDKVAQRYCRDILTDIPSEASRPRNWSEDDERNLRLSVLKVSQ